MKQAKEKDYKNLVKRDVIHKMKELGIEGEKVTLEKASAYLDLALSSIISVLEDATEPTPGEDTRLVSKLVLVNFGTFEVKRMQARHYYSPKNQQEVFGPPKKRVLFKSGKLFNDSVQDIEQDELKQA